MGGTTLRERDREFFKTPVLLYQSSNILSLVLTTGRGSDGGRGIEKSITARKKEKKKERVFAARLPKFTHSWFLSRCFV